MDYRFQVNLGGIINLLANNLYSGPKVFLRELLQNGIDAIHAREQFDRSFAGKGRISIEVIDAPSGAGTGAAGSGAGAGAGSLASASPTIICEDNGIGLTEAEVHKFLATIGESSKRGELGEARTDFIGQFGIGLLSCFMVAEEIVVITRSARGDAKQRASAVEWRGRPDGTYTVKTIESTGEPGTRVYLRASTAGKELFNAKTVRELAEKYGSLLPYPITVTSGGGAGKRAEEINAPAPWEQTFASPRDRRKALLEYGKDVFDVDFLDVIPLESQTGDVHGVAFVLPYSPSPSAKGRHRVYLKRMLLSEAGEGILPEWAFFVRCVINANGLRPTAAREGFYEDDALAAARQSLGECLRSYLLDLGQTDSKRLQKVVQIHYLAIKALAVYDEEFYRTFIDFIPVETSLGTMSMKELREGGEGGGAGGAGGKRGRGTRVVKYVPTVDEFRQVARVAAAQGLCVANGGYTYNEELLLRLPEVFDNVRVEAVGAATLAQSFDELSLDEREKCHELLKAAQLALQPFRAAGDVRKYEPAELAALFTTDPDAALSRAVEQSKDIAESHITSMLDSILAGGAGTGKEPQAYLLFNYNSPLVQQLATVRDAPLLRRCVEMLYVQALLLGHHPLSSRELNLLNTGLSALIQSVVAGGGGGGGGKPQAKGE